MVLSVAKSIHFLLLYLPGSFFVGGGDRQTSSSLSRTPSPLLRCGNAITIEQTSFPKKVFAAMGALDGLCMVMQIFASTYLGGALIILLSQVRSTHYSSPVQ